MISSTRLRTVLVHFDAGADLDGRQRPHGGSCMPLSEGTLARMRWYLEWLSEGGHRVHVLVPSDLGAPDSDLLGATTLGEVIRYRDEGDLCLQLPKRRRHTFIVNGNQLPIIHWRKATSSARRHTTDVLVFGPSGALTGTEYPESVLANAEGQVVRFKRHYIDSPGFADRWTGDAAFLVVKPEHAQAVAAHIVVRGWGLDSIGALVRRFGVRWLSDRKPPMDASFSPLDWMDLAVAIPSSNGGRLIKREDELVNGGKARLAPVRFRGPRRGIQKHRSDGGAHEHRVDPFDPQSSTFSTGDGAGGEYTLSTDDLLEVNGGRAYLAAKRALDVFVSAAALLALSPLMVVVALLIKLTSRGPVFYVHTRQGLDGREFPCLKFRSMWTGADAIQAELRALNEVDGPQFKMKRDPRVTRIGHWLRKTNVDELPQLFNVLFGQMSLVGPRPSPDQENQYCPAWRSARLSTKPGITGLWQVLRNREECTSDFQEWIYYDVEYARHRCFWLDLQILFYTPIAMFAPKRVAPFAARLEQAEICAHSHRMASNPASA